MTHSAHTPPTSDGPGSESAHRGRDDPAARSGPRDPVTGADDHTTGERQAAENEETDPVA